MKKLATLLLAGSVIGLASCGNENNSTNEQIDSMATYRTDTMEASLRAKNDSLINEMARMRADSALRADSMARLGAAAPRKSGSASNTTKASGGTKTTTKPETIGNGKPKMGSGGTQNPNTIGDGKPKMGDKNEKSSSNTIGTGKPKMGDK